MNRRDVLKAALATALPSVRTWAQPRFTSDPFRLGVASGDPWPDGVVLWTRLATAPLQPNGGMPPMNVPVNWRVALDEGMTRIVQKGSTIARPEWAHSVHAEVQGLEPERWYWYQFDTGEGASRVESQ